MQGIGGAPGFLFSATRYKRSSKRKIYWVFHCELMNQNAVLQCTLGSMSHGKVLFDGISACSGSLVRQAIMHKRNHLIVKCS